MNENSLKLLSSVIENLQQKRSIRPTTLAFYLRSKDEKELKAGKFTLVNIQLNEQDLRKTILSILKTCNLPTTFIDKIEEEKPASVNKNDIKSKFWSQHFSGENIDFSELEDDPIYASILMRRKMNSVPDTLK